MVHRPVSTHILQGTLVLSDRLAERGQLVVEGGRIQAIVTGEPRYTVTNDYGDAYIAPGFIDLHIHGMAGASVMDASPASLAHMARHLAAQGTTVFLPTTVTESLETIRRVIAAVAEFQESPPEDGSQIGGMHLEGPWIAPDYKGMQNEAYILPPDVETATELVKAVHEPSLRVTVAPELPGAEALISKLRDKEVFISIGHTGATYEQALAAVDLGATHVTHCFNAMSPFLHRAPGVAGAAMLSHELYVELIADGLHVHPAAMRLLIRNKGRERVMLVTDALSAAGLGNGVYQLGGKDVFVRDGAARLADGTLASSTLTMDAAIRNVIRWCNVSIVDAIYMASTTPAEAMGWDDYSGRLRAGYEADIAVLDRNLQPFATWIHGVQTRSRQLRLDMVSLQ
jgi:N-acetylglucosamine-6-phosphate deacetylase